MRRSAWERLLGQRVPALRSGGPRHGPGRRALCLLVHTVAGFTNRSLCAQVRSLPGGPYTSAQATCNLRRRRLKDLIRRLDGQHRTVLAPEGVRVAALCTKVHRRLLGTVDARSSAGHAPASAAGAVALGRIVATAERSGFAGPPGA